MAESEWEWVKALRLSVEEQTRFVLTWRWLGGHGLTEQAIRAKIQRMTFQGVSTSISSHRFAQGGHGQHDTAIHEGLLWLVALEEEKYYRTQQAMDEALASWYIGMVEEIHAGLSMSQAHSLLQKLLSSRPYERARKPPQVKGQPVTFVDIDEPLKVAGEEVLRHEALADVAGEQPEGALLGELPEQAMTAQERYVFEARQAGFSGAEVARKLKVSEPRVSQIYRSALKKLKQLTE